MREAAQRKAEDGGDRIGDEADQGRPDHAEGADRDHGQPRVHDLEAEAAMEERREIAAEQTTDVGEQKRQPGEQRELIEVHAARADHVERYPEGESLPCRLGQERAITIPMNFFCYRTPGIDGFVPKAGSRLGLLYFTSLLTST